MQEVEAISSVADVQNTSRGSFKSSASDVSFEDLMDKIVQRDEFIQKDLSLKETTQIVSNDSHPSPMEIDESNKISPIAENPSDITQNVISKLDKSRVRIDDLKRSLKNINASDLPQSTRHSLRNKLSHVNDKMQIALSLAGAEPGNSPRVSLVDSVRSFLGSLSHAQTQMGNLGEHLAGMAKNKKELGMTEMMAVQIKIHQVQQQVEFFSATLNQSLQGFKSLLQTQV
jgi:hypothetical protein